MNSTATATSSINSSSTSEFSKRLGSCDRFSPSSASCASIDSGYYEHSIPSSPESSCYSSTNILKAPLLVSIPNHGSWTTGKLNNKINLQKSISSSTIKFPANSSIVNK